MNAPEYLELWEKGQAWKGLRSKRHQARLRRCAEAVAGGQTFADVGCAFGHSTAILRGFCPGLWTGIDFGARAVSRAAELFPDIRFVYRREIDDLPALGRFDGVVCSEVIEHVEDPGALVAALWGMTGRRLVVTTPARKVISAGHLRTYTEEALYKLFWAPLGARIERDDHFFYVTAERD